MINPAASFKCNLTYSGPSTNKEVVVNPFVKPKTKIFSKANQS